MKRCLVMLPHRAVEWMSEEERREAIRTRQEEHKELARRIEGMHPDVVIERVGSILIIAQVPDELVAVIRHDMGCTVDDASGRPLAADGVFPFCRE